MKPPCERDCPGRTVGCHTKCAPYLEYDAYTSDAKKRCKSVERLRKAGLLK